MEQRVSIAFTILTPCGILAIKKRVPPPYAAARAWISPEIP
jgi:hypothetical protein